MRRSGLTLNDAGKSSEGSRGWSRGARPFELIAGFQLCSTLLAPDDRRIRL